MTRVVVVLALAALFATAASATLQDDISAYVKGVMACSGIPGLAVGVVRANGSVIFSDTFGFRDASKNPVTPNTVFGIGSTSKAFTAALAGMLQDDGLWSLDVPMRNYLPAFQMLDPMANAALTPRDMLSHRTGLPSTWEGIGATDRSRADWVYAARYASPTAPLRTNFGYNNLMIASVGFAEGYVANNTSWDSLLQKRLLTPLGMTSTFPTFAAAEAGAAEYAYPMFFDPKANEWMNLQRSVNHNIDLFAPAGAMNSNLKDMQKWVRFWLQRGQTPDGQTLLSKGAWRDILSLNMFVGADSRVPNDAARQYMEFLKGFGYGLCWGVGSYRGYRRNMHNGDTSGYNAVMAIFPENDFGIVILSNGYRLLGPTQLDNFREVIVSYIADRVLGLPPMLKDAQAACQFPCSLWPGLCAAGKQSSDESSSPAAAATAAEPVDAAIRRSLPASLAAQWAAPGAPLRFDAPDAAFLQRLQQQSRPQTAVAAAPAADFVGSYEHPFMGTMTISTDAQGALQATMYDRYGPLVAMPAAEFYSWGMQTKNLPDPATPTGFVTLDFRRGVSGKVVSARLHFVAGSSPSNFLFINKATWSAAADGGDDGVPALAGTYAVTAPVTSIDKGLSNGAVAGLFIGSAVISAVVAAVVGALAFHCFGKRSGSSPSDYQRHMA